MTLFRTFSLLGLKLSAPQDSMRLHGTIPNCIGLPMCQGDRTLSGTPSWLGLLRWAPREGKDWWP